MGQNVYDDDRFFAAYSALPRSEFGLAAAPEFPVMASFLPDLDGAAVIDLGCGFGFFCRWAMEHGAASVLGVDLSERMLARAARENSMAGITYQRADIEEVDLVALRPGSFDVAYSSLTMHYFADLGRFLRLVHALLRPHGRFVFSCEHPIATAPTTPGFIQLDGRTVWPLSDYHSEGPRVTEWLTPGVVKHHRTLTTLIDSLHGAGLRLDHLHEWSPSRDDLEAFPSWANEVHRPMFLLGAASRD